jgi:hypothetical protein
MTKDHVLELIIAKIVQATWILGVAWCLLQKTTK